MGKKMSTYTDLVGKTQRKRPVGRPRLIWKDNVLRRPEFM
jgi:hypothetical protein